MPMQPVFVPNTETRPSGQTTHAPVTTVGRKFVDYSGLGVAAIALAIGAVVAIAFMWNGGYFTPAHVAAANALVKQAEFTAARAEVNSIANAMAGFGNNDLATQQYAVPKPVAPVPMAAPQAPAYVPPAPSCFGPVCGGGRAAAGPTGGRFDRVQACLARLGVRPGEVRPVNDHAILAPGVAQRLEATGQLGAARACVRGG